MSTVANPAACAHPTTRPGEPWLPLHLAPLAAELVGTVRDYGPDDVDAVLGRVPDEKRTELVLVLAAMVDPDRSPADLLAWTCDGPVQTRGDAAGTKPSEGVSCPDCGRSMRRDHLERHRAGRRCASARRAA